MKFESETSPFASAAGPALADQVSGVLSSHSSSSVQGCTRQRCPVNQDFSYPLQRAEKIQKILRNTTQSALAEKLGINKSSVSVFAAGKKQPGPATCLALAGVCPPEDVAYWIEQSELSRAALATISTGLGIAVQGERLSGQERELLKWWRDTPNNPHDRGLRGLVENRLGTTD